jgi:ATP-dependent Clp protease ATP-binding subunit ClpX
LVKQYTKLFSMEDVALTFTDDALESVAQKAIERKTGARGLRSILESVLLDTMFDLPSLEGVAEIVVDKDVIEGRKDPVKVFAKTEKSKKEDAA